MWLLQKPAKTRSELSRVTQIIEATWGTPVFLCSTSLRLPAFSSERNPKLAHPAPECIWMKPEDLGSSSRPVDLATGRIQGLPYVFGGYVVQWKQISIPA
jgi:hypothetical protein